MNLSGNTILITGGATGIGLALAERFLNTGSEVIICGRRADKLEEAKARHQKLHTVVADLAQASERVRLFEHVTREFPKLNVLVNNAGVQLRMPVADSAQNWEQQAQEIAINLEAPVHLSALFINHLKQQKEPAIINVTSGLAFAPLAMAAVYSATKAALHSFTLSLRHQLAQTAIQVLEIIPPAVNTDLGGAGLHNFGVNLNEFADSVFSRLGNGEEEIGFGTSDIRRKASREELDEYFKQMNSR